MRGLLATWLTLVMVVVGCSSGEPRVSPDASDPGGLPSVTIESPASGTRLNVGQTLRVSVRGEDVRGVSRLDLRVGDVLVASASTPNAAAQPSFSATLEWTPSAEGGVTITALAYRPTGTGSMPASIGVTVVPATSAVSPSPVFGFTATPSLPPNGTPTDETPSVAPGGATAEPTRAPRPTAPPAPRRKPRSTPEPTPDPTKTPRPRSTPEPTPEPTPKPTPKPTPTPTPTPTPPPTSEPVTADLRVRERDIPDTWNAGAEREIKVSVRNVGDTTSPRFVIRARIGGGELERLVVEEGGLEPGTSKVFSLVVQAPDVDGTRTLTVMVRLLDDAVDANPGNNVLEKSVEIQGGD